MTLMLCDKCGKEVGSDMNHCPNCGVKIAKASPEDDVKEPPKEKKKAATDSTLGFLWIIIIPTLIGILILVSIMFLIVLIES